MERGLGVIEEDASFRCMHRYREKTRKEDEERKKIPLQV